MRSISRNFPSFFSGKSFLNDTIQVDSSLNDSNLSLLDDLDQLNQGVKDIENLNIKVEPLEPKRCESPIDFNLSMVKVEKEEGEEISENFVKSPQILRLSIQTYLCLKCNFETALRSRYRRHKQMCKISKSKRRKLDPRVLFMDESTLQCQKCDFITKDQDYLTVHMRNIHKDFTNSFQEPICKMTLSEAMKVKSKKCKICQYKIKNNNHRKNHLISKHFDLISDVEIYKCEKCRFKTGFKPALNLHMKKCLIRK